MDDDDKVRRNLMVVSFAVLLYFWLDLPDTLIAKRLIGEEAALSAWKVWLVLVVVITYLLLRFFTVTQLSEGWAAAKGLFDSKRTAFLHDHVRRHATEILGGTLPRWVSFEDPTGAFKSNLTTPNLERLEDAARQTLSLRGDFNKLRGDDPYLFAFLVVGDALGMKGVGAIFLNVPRNERWRLDAKFLLQMARTPYVIEFGVPVLVGYAALLSAVGTLTHRLLGALS